MVPWKGGMVEPGPATARRVAPEGPADHHYCYYHYDYLHLIITIIIP